MCLWTHLDECFGPLASASALASGRVRTYAFWPGSCCNILSAGAILHVCKGALAARLEVAGCCSSSEGSICCCCCCCDGSPEFSSCADKLVDCSCGGGQADCSCGTKPVDCSCGKGLAHCSCELEDCSCGTDSRCECCIEAAGGCGIWCHACCTCSSGCSMPLQLP